MTAAAAASLAQRGVSRDGAAVFAAESDGRLLAAILVGWGARRAFYLRGGSTDEGYRQNAAVWLHWRVMNVLRERGITAYNLGGTPEGARLPEHGQHGLYRFKVGLGAEQVATAGLRITLRRRHVALHRVVARLKRARAGEEAMAEAHL